MTRHNPEPAAVRLRRRLEPNENGLRVRKPSGAVAYPLLLVEGPEKSGKTFTALSLAASERVGRTFVFELGERAADEYAPLGDYEIVELNGTYADLLDQVRAATREPQEDERPNAVVLDSASMLWSLLKDQASSAARRSKRAQQILADDPDADIETTMTYWTKAKDKWWAVLNVLRTWPGITVLTARAGEVAKVHNGQPVAGQTEWSRDVEKGTPFAMTGIIRCQYPKPPVLTAVQSLTMSIPAKGLELPAEASLESLIFDTLGAGGFAASPLVSPSAGIEVAEAKNVLFTEACDAVGRDRAKEPCEKAWAAVGLEGRAEVTEAELKAASEALREVLANLDPFEDLPHAKPVDSGESGASPSSDPTDEGAVEADESSAAPTLPMDDES